MPTATAHPERMRPALRSVSTGTPLPSLETTQSSPLSSRTRITSSRLAWWTPDALSSRW